MSYAYDTIGGGTSTYDTENTAKKTWSQYHQTWSDSHFMWSSPGANFTNDSVGAGTYTYDDE